MAEFPGTKALYDTIVISQQKYGTHFIANKKKCKPEDIHGPQSSFGVIFNQQNYDKTRYESPCQISAIFVYKNLHCMLHTRISDKWFTRYSLNDDMLTYFGQKAIINIYAEYGYPAKWGLWDHQQNDADTKVNQSDIEYDDEKVDQTDIEDEEIILKFHALRDKSTFKAPPLLARLSKKKQSNRTLKTSPLLARFSKKKQSNPTFKAPPLLARLSKKKQSNHTSVHHVNISNDCNINNDVMIPSEIAINDADNGNEIDQEMIDTVLGGDDDDDNNFNCFTNPDIIYDGCMDKISAIGKKSRQSHNVIASDSDNDEIATHRIRKLSLSSNFSSCSGSKRSSKDMFDEEEQDWMASNKSLKDQCTDDREHTAKLQYD